MGRREQNKADKRARIAVAATTLFETQGFDATTVRAIARAAGVGTGTVLLHYESKTELLFALFVDALEAEVEARTASLPDGPLLDQLLYLFRGFLERYTRHPALYRVYVKETLFQTGPGAQRYDALNQRFLSTLVAVVSAHAAELRPGVKPGAIALQAFSVYLVHVALFLRSPAPELEPALWALRGLFDDLLAPLMQPRT